SKNAAATLVWMGLILGSVFIGLSYLAVQVRALPEIAVIPGADQHLGETVVSQVGRMVFGTGPLYLVLQIATCLILVLAANTSFAGFPRLCAIQARDGFMPRQLANIGDKLVFNNGIMGLAALSALLIVIFRGSTHLLIPLYAVGVFLSFTLSQSGMVRRWLRLRTPGWRVKAIINGFGATATCIVMLVFITVKFTQGAWFVVILIPALIFIFFRINAHYRSVAKQLSLEDYRPQQGMRHHMLVLASDIHRGVIPALQYARALSSDVKALHVSIDPARERRVRERWMLYSRGVPLVVLDSPYRSLVDPIIEYVDRLQQQDPRNLITLVIPEFVPKGWWPKFLHGQAGLMLALRLRSKRGVVVINMPYHIEAYVPLASGQEATKPEQPAQHAGDGMSAHDIASLIATETSQNGAVAKDKVR
ncbi:MAG TPA: amino acid permease, partial [Abditibacteriaceae bacterium]|nr:amino acid permease [Abditibacteriaceae bacterium]